jgi:hypothetical protein
LNGISTILCRRKKVIETFSPDVRMRRLSCMNRFRAIR